MNLASPRRWRGLLVVSQSHAVRNVEEGARPSFIDDAGRSRRFAVERSSRAARAGTSTRGRGVRRDEGRRARKRRYVTSGSSDDTARGDRGSSAFAVAETARAAVAHRNRARGEDGRHQTSDISPASCRERTPSVSTRSKGGDDPRAGGGRHRPATTIVVVDGDVMGKPRTRPTPRGCCEASADGRTRSSPRSRSRGAGQHGSRASRGCRWPAIRHRRRIAGLHRDARANGKGRRVRNTGIRRDDRRSRGRRLLRRHGPRAPATVRLLGRLGLRYAFGPLEVA